MTILYVLNTYILYIHTTCYIYCIHYGVADVCANKQNPPPLQDILWSFCGAGLMRTTDITRPTAYESTRIHKVCRACWSCVVLVVKFVLYIQSAARFSPAFGRFWGLCPFLPTVGPFKLLFSLFGLKWPFLATFSLFSPTFGNYRPSFFGIFWHF